MDKIENEKMELSTRAENYLKNLKWKESIKDEEKILKAFEKEGLTPTKELIRFQMKYGGLTVGAGLEPMVYGILHIDKRSPGETCELDYHERENTIYYQCADTLYQMNFDLISNGNYCEDYCILSRSFDTQIEDWSMWAEIKKENYKLIYQHFPFPTYEMGTQDFEDRFNACIKEFKNVKIIDGWWDDILRWYSIGDDYIARKGFTGVFTYGIYILSKNTVSKDEEKYFLDIFEKMQQ